MNSARGLGGLLGFALLMAATPARGADAPPASRAEKLFYDGLDALGRHDYERAREDFAASVALVPRGSALRNLATVDWALGRHVDALKHLRMALEMADLPAEMRERAKRDVDAAYAATGHIVLNTDGGASVTIDGATVDGVAPFAGPFDVEPGVRMLEARLSGRVGHCQVDAMAGVIVKAEVHVSPEDAAPPASTAAPPLSSAILPTDRAAPAEQQPSSFWNMRRTVGAAIAGAGLASVGVGAVFFAEATSAEHRASSAGAGLGPSSCALSEPSRACAMLSDARSSQRTNAIASQVLVGAGIAGALAGAAVLLWPEPAQSHRIAAIPLIGARASGFALQGSF